MKSKKLYEAFSYIDDRYLDIVDTPQKETTDMNIKKHIPTRKLITYALAAAICISILTVTAAAAGWIPKIFAAIKPAFPEDAAVLEAALAVTQSQEPETFSVPEVDFTQFTLYERYYDGESILLGYDLSKVMPKSIVGFQPDEILLSKIKDMPEYMCTPAEGKVNDTLDLYLDIGFITEDEYIFMLENRTEYAKTHDLRKYWQITLDWMLKEELTPEQYEMFWTILKENGACCIAIPAKPWIADHISVNDTDCGEVLGPNCENFRTDYTTEFGDCILLMPLPETVRNQDSVTVELSLRSGWHYWYMELDGDVYSHFESNAPYEASFLLENVNN